MTKEDLLKKPNYSLSMKALRDFVDRNKDVPDSAPCLIERVEDIYFTGRELNGNFIGGWNVLKVEGYHYHNSLKWNEKMRREIELRKEGKGEYDEKLKPEENIFGEKELEEMKEQFYEGFGITTDKEIVYIYSHY